MKEKIISFGFGFSIFLGAILTFSLKDTEISVVERRKLATKDVLKENFNANLDKYLTDQFVFRNNLLSLNSAFKRYILRNQEDNDVYLKEDFIIEKNYPLDLKSLNNFITKLNLIKDKYLQNSRVYSAFIRDKAYYLDSKKNLTIDYKYMNDILNKKLNIANIDTKDLFKLEDYYKTDIHLKQNSYFKLVEKLSKYYDFEFKNINYEEKVFPRFKGASFYKVPFRQEEELLYLTNYELDKVQVKHLEYTDNCIYQEKALETGDPYNIFLSGPSSLIEIENANLDNNKELIIFRDSFGSSLAPLLVPYYKKIILVDLRYISMDLASKYVDFNNKDILFLYSTLIINNSYILKI